MGLGGSFNTYLQRNIITNCDVRVYQNIANGGYFLDRTNIASFRMERHNDGVVSNAPNDSATIEIVRWSNISSTYRTILSTRGSYVKVGFAIENVVTTYKIVMCVKECKVDKRRNMATVTLVSPFDFMTGNNYVAEVAYDVLDYGGGAEVTRYNYDSYPLRSQTTFFEGAQFEALSKGQAIVATNVQSSQAYPLPSSSSTFPPFNQDNYYTLKSLTSTTITYLVEEVNILSDITDSIDENDRSGINFFGLESGEVVPVLSGNGEQYAGQQFQLTLKLDKPYVITRVFVGNALAQDLTNEYYWRVSNNSVFFISKTLPSSSGTRYCVAYGYEAKLIDTVTALDNNTNPYVFLPTYLDTNSKKTTAQTDTRTYYSHRTYIEFDCRLDPRIEPMDNIYVANVGIIRVESVSMDYQGSFRGHIKGRKIAEPITLQPISVTSLSYSANTFSLVVNNPNNRAVNVYAVTDDGTEITLGAVSYNSSKTFTEITASSLLPYIHSAFMQELTTNINLKTTDNTYPTVIQSNVLVPILYALTAPYVEINSYDENNFEVVVYNNNDCDAEINVEYSSDRFLYFNVSAHDTFILNNSNAGQLFDSFRMYHEHELTDPVYCYFSARPTTAIQLQFSDNEFILETNNE